MKKKLCCGLCILVTYLFLSIFLLTPCLAFKDYRDCVDNLKFEDIDFGLPFAKAQRQILNDYIICRAVRRGQPDICSQTSDTDRCKKKSSIPFVECWGRLAKDGDLSARAYAACLNKQEEKLEDSPKLRQYFKAIAQKNPKGCEGNPNADRCRAAAARDYEGCPDKECRNIVVLFNAIEKKNSDRCMSLETIYERPVCMGYAADHDSSCENAFPAYRSFKNDYCASLFPRRRVSGANAVK